MNNELNGDSNISLTFLLGIADKILTEYMKRGLSFVNLGNRQYYHAIAANEMFDLTKTPKELVIGDLDDDISELKRLVNGDMPTAVDLERLGRILIAVSESVLE